VHLGTCIKNGNAIQAAIKKMTYDKRKEEEVLRQFAKELGIIMPLDNLFIIQVLMYEISPFEPSL
jgi:hypothetical protein